MTDPRLDDDQLTAHLRRRAEEARHSHDWVRGELLPSINAAIDTRPQRVGTTRGPAFAGLAGIAAILLVLVVALPGFVPGPSRSEPPVGGTDTPRASSSPAPLQLLSAQEFAVEVLTGRLRSSTVLVDGTIGPRPEGELDCQPPDQLCLMGRLEGTDPSVDVHARWLPAKPEDSLTIGGRDLPWPWWQQSSGPITGTLVLSVDSGGVIEFLGRAGATASPDPLTVAEAAQIDVESLALDSVVLVDGWLTGIGGFLQCPAPEPGTTVPGLSVRYCGNSAWVTDDPDGRPRDFVDPEMGIQVQNGAYYAFASDPSPHSMEFVTVEPRRATYALSRRLEGWCAPASPPCWQWEVVGRLSSLNTAPPDATPTTPMTSDPNSRTIACSRLVVLPYPPQEPSGIPTTAA